MNAQRNTTNTSTERQSPGLRRPFMLAYSVKPIDDGRQSVWSKIGAAWAHKDGEGYEVRMDAFPVDGRLVLRTIKDRDGGQSDEVLEPTPE